ncbi:MAG: hypothetical protein ABR526_03540 [Chthoniobacterales bacterium]
MRLRQLRQFVVGIAFAALAASADARVRNQLVLADSPEDPALVARIAQLGPRVDPIEARKVSSLAYTTGRELAHEWRMGPSPVFHSFLIHMGARKYGYCFQFAEELLKRLNTLKLKTLELHWAESDAGTDTEHNVIVVTARGQPFAEGIMLDNWRHSGHLLYGPLDGDPTHTWNENAGEFAARSKRIGLPPTPGR